MPTTKRPANLPTVPPPLPKDQWPTRLSTKDLDGFERQVANAQTKDPQLGVAWRHMAGVLFAMASKQGKLSGLNTIQFFIPDGKHRQQVFAMHLPDTPELIVYSPNVVEAAVKLGIITAVATVPNVYSIGHGQQLTIEPLDRETINPQPYYKDMTGWNRKAIGIHLPPQATEQQLHAAGQICVLASGAWPQG